MDKYVIVLLFPLFGCAGLPSYDACETLRYERTKEQIEVVCKRSSAVITLPSIPGL
jgi:hypothetical protein